MILENIRFLVTQNSERQILENIDLRMAGDKISEIGNLEPEQDERRFDCSGKIVLPGLINTHTHASMSLLRGISDNKKLMDWLEEDIFPAEDEMNSNDIYTGALLASVEMLESGTTCFNDMYEQPDEIAEAVEKSGIRAVISRAVFDWDGDGEKRETKAKETVREYQDHELITPSIAPHAIYSCSIERLRDVKEFSEQHGVPFHIHVSETKKENEDAVEEHGNTPTQHLEEHGILDSTVVAAHSTWLSEEDRELFEKREANIAHNPAANLKLGSGIADIPELMDKGVNVSLGTDGPASNNNFNMFEEMKLAGLLHKRNNPENITEQDLLDMATINGAEALGLEDEVGSIEEGKLADLLVVDLDDSELTPFYGKQGLISNLVFSYTGSPEKVFVNGDLTVERNETLGVDKKKLLDKVQSKVEKFDASRKK